MALKKLIKGFFAIGTGFVTFLLYYRAGYLLTSVGSVSVLAIAFTLKYKMDGIGAGFAYWLVMYIGFAVTLMGIGLLQSHAGCQSLIGDCYVPNQPSWLFDFKMLFGVMLMILNVSAAVVSVSIIFPILDKRKEKLLSS